MSEVYPSDNSLLNIVSDEQTGVEYIETGKAPYYLEFRKLLYRLLLAVGRANDLRVYDEGDLDVGVKAGEYFSGSAQRSYSGSEGNTLIDDATNYIYLDSEGILQINTTGHPEVTTNHIRLATVICAGGDISAIIDDRGQHILTSFGFPVGSDALTSMTSGGITTGGLACKRIESAELKVLLNGVTNSLFTVETGDVVVQIVFCVKTATGAVCTVNIGFDAEADGASADDDGWVIDADANLSGQYSTENDNYDGIYVIDGGRVVNADGNVTITSSTDQSGSSFEGGVYMIYIPA